MEIRQLIAEHRKSTTAIISVVLVIAIVTIILQLRPAPTPGPPAKAFYTTDDGATYYSDAITNLPPYLHNGKQAVRARVFQGANGKTFVAYLLRFSQDKREKLSKEFAANPSDAQVRFDIINGANEIKKPLTPEEQWAAVGSGRGNAAANYEIPRSVQEPIAPLEP